MQNTVWFRNLRLLRFVSFGLLAFPLVGNSWAENNSNYVFNGTTTNFGVALYIPMPSAGTNNSLQILNGGAVTNNGGALGLNGGDNDNYAIVNGVGSIWQNNSGLSIGSVGSRNSLLITNGGLVQITGSDAYVGSTGSRDNNVTVTGAGSTFNVAGTYYAGYAGMGSRTVIDNGGTINAVQTWFGLFGGSSNSSMLVTGTGSLLNDSSVIWMGPGANCPSNSLTIANGAHVVSSSAIIGYDVASGNNVATVDGAGSIWSNDTTVAVGQGGTNNRLIVSNGGRVVAGSGVNVNNGGGFNMILLTDPNSLIETPSLSVGAFGQNATMVISNGARANATYGYLSSGNATSSNNVLIVTGAGSVMSNSTATYISYVGPSNKMIIANGGRVDSGDAYFNYYLAPGNNWYGNGGAAEITGTGSQWNVNGTLVMNLLGYDSDMVISNGGRVSVGGVMQVGGGNSNSTVVVTGAGSMLQVGSYITVGKNGVYSSGSNSHLLVTAGGTLECNSLVGGSSFGEGSISNVGGVYQFTIAAPSVSFSGSGIMMKDATVSYRDVNGADINSFYINQISKQGDNTFQLNNSTNAMLASYTFNTGNPSNYYRLALVNGGSRWQSTALTIGSGGVLLVSNSSNARVSGVVSNAGNITVANSKVTFDDKVTISGMYRSDPSTNTFNSDVIVTQGGIIQADQGDLFDFKKSFYIHSANTAFHLGASAVQFSSGGMHTNAITGQDLGTNSAGFDHNFAYGELHLGSSADQICFECGNIPLTPSNGLYIGWLDLLGDANLVTNLHSTSGINIYYDKTDARNAYLNDLTYHLTDCNFAINGGFLVPVIPEPSALVLFVVAACAMLWRRRTY